MKEQTPKDTCVVEIGPKTLTIINYNTPNNEHNYENLCSHSRNPQTCASNKGRLDSGPILVDAL